MPQFLRLPALLQLIAELLEDTAGPPPVPRSRRNVGLGLAAEPGSEYPGWLSRGTFILRY